MSTIVQTEVISDKKFTLVFDEDGSPAVDFENKHYRKLPELVAKASFLSDPRNLRQFVRIANFLFTGQEFMLIENVAEYQKRYRANAGKLTREYGIYDVSSLKDPYVEKGKAIFFAEKNSSGVPYKVICTYPFDDESAECAYTLLPEKFDESR